MLAERQSRFRVVWPQAAASYEDSGRCSALLEPLLRTDEAFGFWRDSTLVGFVAGSSDGRWGVVPAAGHAVSGTVVDAPGVYGELYAALSERWIERGVLIHDVELPALRDVEESWNDLGFGRRVCFGSRPTTLLADDLAPGSGVRIRLAEQNDLPAIVRLAALEVEFRQGPPIYLEGGPPDTEYLRTLHAGLFEKGGVQFVALVDGDVVGILTLLYEGRFAPICADAAPFVSTTVTDPTRREAGIGRMLVRAAADWAREQGHENLDVSFQVSSPLLRSFWRRAGFVPIGWKVARRLPESLLNKIDHTVTVAG
jgi:GNAT superfamily N-acetyltransferase